MLTSLSMSVTESHERNRGQCGVLVAVGVADLDGVDVACLLAVWRGEARLALVGAAVATGCGCKGGIAAAGAGSGTMTEGRGGRGRGITPAFFPGVGVVVAFGLSVRVEAALGRVVVVLVASGVRLIRGAKWRATVGTAFLGRVKGPNGLGVAGAGVPVGVPVPLT